MITVRPYTDADARAVFASLDQADAFEAALVRGRGTDAMALWADWRAMVPAHVLSVVALDRRRDGLGNFADVPFAVVALANTGQAGVAQAALLARDHKFYRTALARLAVTIRRRLPDFMRDNGINRIEARSWGDHPTAGRLLRAIGFAREAVMVGFGASGSVNFHQWATISPDISGLCNPWPPAMDAEAFTRRHPAPSPKETAPCA